MSKSFWHIIDTSIINHVCKNEACSLKNMAVVTTLVLIIFPWWGSPLNNFGHKLLEFSQTCNLCILNGRYGTNSSKPTCNNKSVVDYALYSYECFECIKPYFHVSDFDNLISDVHAAIHVTLEWSSQTHQTQTKT